VGLGGGRGASRSLGVQESGSLGVRESGSRGVGEGSGLEWDHGPAGRCGRLLGGGCSVFVFEAGEVFGELHGSGGSFFHGALDGPLVATENVLFAGILEVAAFDVEEDIYLEGPESVAVHGSAQQFLDQAVEAREHDFAVLDGVYHPNIISAVCARNLMAPWPLLPGPIRCISGRPTAKGVNRPDEADLHFHTISSDAG